MLGASCREGFQIQSVEWVLLERCGIVGSEADRVEEHEKKENVGQILVKAFGIDEGLLCRVKDDLRIGSLVCSISSSFIV